MGIPNISILLITVFVLCGVLLIPVVFYLLSLSNTLKAIKPENRKMSPSHVWLMLIPIFGMIWHFITVHKLSESIKAECNSLGVFCEDEPGYSLGIAMCALLACSWIPYLGAVAYLGGVVCWIVYWSKISSYKSLILSSN